MTTSDRLHALPLRPRGPSRRRRRRPSPALDFVLICAAPLLAYALAELLLWTLR